MKINFVNKVQNDLLENRALVSLSSILFCQVGSRLVPGIFALGVRRGEMPPRKSHLGWETVVAPPTVFLVPWTKDKCVCTCACVCHPEGAPGVLAGICRRVSPCVGFPGTCLSDSRNSSFLTRLARSCILKCWINWQVAFSLFPITTTSRQRFAP